MEMIQILIVLFALFAYSRVVARTKDKKVSFNEFIFWSVLWIGIIAVALVPSVTSPFASLFGIGRGADFVVYLSIIALFYLIFRVYVKAEKIEKNITRLVREISLKK